MLKLHQNFIQKNQLYKHGTRGLKMFKLKSCPFCGKEGTLTWNQPLGYSVGCLTTACRCRITAFSAVYPTEELAIQSWNKRK